MVDFAIETVFAALDCILDFILAGASGRLALRWEPRREKLKSRPERQTRKADQKGRPESADQKGRPESADQKMQNRKNRRKKLCL